MDTLKREVASFQSSCDDFERVVEPAFNYDIFEDNDMNARIEGCRDIREKIKMELDHLNRRLSSKEYSHDARRRDRLFRRDQDQVSAVKRQIRTFNSEVSGLIHDLSLYHRRAYELESLPENEDQYISNDHVGPLSQSFPQNEDQDMSIDHVGSRSELAPLLHQTKVQLMATNPADPSSELTVHNLRMNDEEQHEKTRELLAVMMKELQKLSDRGLDARHLDDNLPEESWIHGQQQDTQMLAKELQDAGIANSSQSEGTDPFCYNISIQGAEEYASVSPRVRAKLDTGSYDNWVSAQVVQDAGLEREISTCSQPKSFRGFENQVFQPMGQIDLTWYPVNKLQSSKHTFFVHEDPPFEVVLGSIFIINDAWSVFGGPEPLLGLIRLGKLGQGEIQELQERAKQNGATKEQTREFQRAADAAKREQKRQSRAASRISRTPSLFTPSYTPSLRGRVSTLATTPRDPSLFGVSVANVMQEQKITQSSSEPLTETTEAQVVEEIAALAIDESTVEAREEYPVTAERQLGGDTTSTESNELEGSVQPTVEGENT